MSGEIRGQETQLRLSVDGQAQVGSWIKVTDWEVEELTDLKDVEYVGEDTDDIDIQHHGFRGSFTVNLQDAKTVDYLTTIIDRESQHLPHPNITIQELIAPRVTGERAFALVYFQCFLKADNHGARGRKENVQMRFSFRSKRRKKVTI